MERVVAIIRQVAFLSVTASAPSSTRGRTVPDSNLTELLVNLEALEAQLLHFLQGRGRTDVDGEGFIACNLTYGLLTFPSTPLPQHILFYFNPCCAPYTETVFTRFYTVSTASSAEELGSVNLSFFHQEAAVSCWCHVQHFKWIA